MLENPILYCKSTTGGNIQNKVEYAFTTGTPSATLNTVSYTYGDPNWKDKITNFNGKDITYDGIGNPLTYNGYTYTWEWGRQLSGISGNGQTISYKYNDEGIRTQKTVSGVITNYHLVGNKVTYEENGTDNAYYTYDSSDNLVSMNLNGVEYYYIRNAQGDIIGLFDKDGATVASYTYDSWGKLISIKDGSGTDITNNTSSVGYKNPYRYRGYRYDIETGLYYLQSRYYNPEWDRFINADAILGQSRMLLSFNMFAYCANNPATMKDPSGFMHRFAADDGGSSVIVSNLIDQMRKAAQNNSSKVIIYNKLDLEGKPNSKDKLYNKDGSVKQERAYGPDRKPLLDTDWNHGGVGHVFPHTHEWKDGKRQDGVPFQGPPPPPRAVSNTQINGWAVAGVVLYWVVSEGSRIGFPPRNLVPVP